MMDSQRPGPIEVVSVGRISVDLYPQQQGPMSEVSTLQKSVGGTATNVAVAVARLGHHAALVTKVGDDAFGADVQVALNGRFGVNTMYISTHPTLKTPLAFAELDPVEEPNIIFYREPSGPDMELVDTDIADLDLRDLKILWMPASRFSAEPSRSTVASMLARRDRKNHTILDLDWRPSFWQNEKEATKNIEPLLSKFSIAIGNREECRIAVGESDPEKAADRLLSYGLEAAVVKLGGDGVLVADRYGLRERIKPFPVEVVCGLGAGDAFGGAFCHGLLSGWSLQKSVTYGNAAGAIVASRLLCADDMPYIDEIEDFLSQR